MSMYSLLQTHTHPALYGLQGGMCRGVCVCVYKLIQMNYFNIISR